MISTGQRCAQVMLGSTLTKLISVFAVGLPLCLLGGLAYSVASGKSLLQGCLQAYAALYKIPGRFLVTLQGPTHFHYMHVCGALHLGSRQRWQRALLQAQ